jgi:Cu/Zn superoxide dismutase
MLSNKIVLTGAIALALITPLIASAKSASKTYPLAPQNGSGEKGTVTLTADGDKTIVAVSISGAPASAQPAHIHPGSCANLNPAPKYPLTSLMNGKSTTTVDATLASLTAGGFAVNVHKSPDDLKDYVACGDLGMAAMSGMKSMMPAATASP